MSSRPSIDEGERTVYTLCIIAAICWWAIFSTSKAITDDGDAMNEFLQGFIKGAKETPKGFFAPAIAIWRLLVEVSESLTQEKGRPHA